MAHARKRVSYIIPSPVEPIRRLQLPPHGVSRLGATGPLLIPDPSDDKAEASQPPSHPRHRLGVAALALDVSTQLVGRSAPECILYSGGRDGLIMSWDLGIRTKRRKGPEDAKGARRRGQWEFMTGWGDDVLDEETDDADERVVSDGDVLGDVTARRRPTSLASEIPHEQQWETDMSSFQPGTPTQFRQSVQAHTDWINDILLCNYNQTVVSASSDGTVKAWNPHSNTPTDPSTIGSHSDYVRCLAYCREQNWVASGSFDRTIKLWDLHRTSSDPLITLNPPDTLAPKSSVYAIAADPYGRTIVSGSPERVVRLWDPRTGRRTGKLVGHTDNIRAILLSEDSKYLLTGSADASVKLWSLASQRCLHTFTHHTDSVWSLFSDHPSLEVFYSGDRSGLVCRVDVEDCPDLSEGECVLLCNESVDQAKSPAEGINKIMVMDDNLLWTATGASTIKRWNIPQRRATRPHPTVMEQENGRLSPSNSPGFKKRALLSAEPPSEASTRPSTGHGHSRRMSFAPSVHSITSEQWRDREHDVKLNGIPYDSLIKLISPNDPFASYSSARTRDPEVATLYSAASIMSVPRYNARSPQQTIFQSSSMTNPMHSSRTEETIMAANTARALFEERELASDALPFCTEPDGIVKGDHGFVRSVILNDRIYALTVDTVGEVAVWDIVRGLCVGKFPAEVVAAASHSGSSAGGSGEREHSPREALEAVRERIEGEAVVSAWCNADTKAGVLTIHLTERCFDAEVYADEVGYANDRNFNDESKLNIGKWVLRNLFIGFIKEEMRRHQDGSLPPSLSRTPSQDTFEQQNRAGSPTSHDSHRRPSRRPSGSTTTIVWSPNMIPAVAPNVSATARSSPLLTPLIPLHAQPRENLGILPPIPQSPAPNPDVTPTPGYHQRARSGTFDGGLTPGLMTPTAQKEDYFSGRVRQQSIQGVIPGSPDDFSGWSNKVEPQTPSTPSGLIGRLKNFGKATKRPVSDALSPAILPTPSTETPIPEGAPFEEVAKTPLQQLLAGPLEPPSSAEAPLCRLPPNTTVLISKEAQPSYTTIYRGTVMSTQYDMESLEAAMPMWLLEYLLMNQTPATAPLVKMSFVLMPWNKDPDVEPLPELLNTAQSKLTASRYLRIRKIVNHVQDKLDKIMPGSKAASVRSLSEQNDHGRPNRPRAEDEYEILCSDTLLPLGMSLAAVRQHVWKQSIELVLHYRRKRIT
ncbi:WD40 repeat-like protein [Pholiota conissans]|uniref:WD40 repeat-like protein n=1 Tax=Pholiota conissans TaxID=109636 RepID=A0A9P6CQV9_9AGAR|nr:WD40 repeat-like protein [Pholiota conissans]